MQGGLWSAPLYVIEDASEKLFRRAKTYLENAWMAVASSSFTSNTV